MDETLDILLLRSFVAIDDFGGFGRAAEALHRSQPTVSQHVRVLENRLGHQLVEKDGRGSRFTPAGRRLLIEARRIIAVHDDAVGRLTGREEPETGAAPVREAAAAADFLRYIAERMPQLIGEWDADRET
ncbi:MULTISPECIES: LysR family transcriptional regulator [unclassified Microbacterium]|uniref:LysR family transcriptional regulator n=1 Tax=unclassified Microbacterium TaxID=2609290 RepID=UPI0012FC5BBA|nr:LysR family transcriptional regulator [Microbacterium sp. MAH-37]MVQ43605.1 LysR family transcriptional regulator [Microbacterium sp. MAH-37]